MAFWKNAGVTYLRYSQLAAQVVRNVKKVEKTDVKAKSTLNITKWEAGKPAKVEK